MNPDPLRSHRCSSVVPAQARAKAQLRQLRLPGFVSDVSLRMGSGSHSLCIASATGSSSTILVFSPIASQRHIFLFSIGIRFLGCLASALR